MRLFFLIGSLTVLWGLIIGLILLALAIIVPVHAETVYAVRPIEGFVCMRLNVTEAQVLNPGGTGIFILTAPDATAQRGTSAPATVFVRKPEHRINNFLEVLQLNGKPGWIAADKVRPMDQNLRCVPSVMSNGRIGGG